MKSLIFTFALVCPVLCIAAERDRVTPNLKFEKGWDDIEPVDYSHLTIALPTVKPEENGLPALAKIAEELSEKYQYSLFRSHNGQLSDEEIWQKKAEVFAKIAPYYEKIDAELAKPHLYELYAFKITSSMPHTVRMISLSRHLQLRTMMHARAGNKEKAWASYQQEIKLATKLRANCNNLIANLVSIAIEASMMESADMLLKLASDDRELRSRVIVRMRREIERQECMRKAMLGEFIFGGIALKSMSSGEVSFDGLIMGDFDTTSNATFWDAVCQPKQSNAIQYLKGVSIRKSMQLGMQPNKTLKVMHERYLKRCKMLKMPPHELAAYERSGNVHKEQRKMKEEVFSKPSSNIVGEGILAISTPIIDRQIVKIYIQPLAIEMVILRDAMRRYKLEKGSYPKTLNLLVPKFIDAIPVDIFAKDKAPIYYNAEKGMLLSVGTQREDHADNWLPKKSDGSINQGFNEKRPFLFLESSTPSIKN